VGHLRLPRVGGVPAGAARGVARAARALRARGAARHRQRGERRDAALSGARRRLARRCVGPHSRSAGSADRQPAGGAALATAVSAPDLPDRSGPGGAAATRLGRVAAPPAGAVRARRTRDRRRSRPARLDRSGLRDRDAARVRGARGRDDRTARAGTVRLAPEPGGAPAESARGVTPAADGARCAAAVERGRGPVLGAGAVQRTHARRPAGRHRHCIPHVERPARPGRDAVGRLARPPGRRTRRPVRGGHLARRALGGGAPPRGTSRRRPRRRDLEAFGRYYRQLRQLLDQGRRALAPAPAPR